MKINFFIIGASTLMLYAQSAPAVNWIEPTDCINCTFDGTCTRYESTCCDPCKTDPDCKTCFKGCKTYKNGDTSCCLECESVELKPACDASTCVSDTSWSSYSTGYQKRTARACNTLKTLCVETTEYRCAAGYYGTSTNGSTGCTKCPSSGNVAGQSAAGSIAITSCYIPSGNTFSDSTGSGTYTGNCYYSN